MAWALQTGDNVACCVRTNGQGHTGVGEFVDELVVASSAYAGAMRGSTPLQNQILGAQFRL